ncbi:MULTISPECIES: polysaccharide lyase family 1 protein [Asticcacaulis]|uniref:pectate lyase family protein n=1 Tax=Asticcacaulis TaxID=76890 RepID=UPI001AE51CA3|nr:MULTISPECIES: pectate lyase [Asticcacaulis]MBP2159302.1 pectate lyase [Asticcacaulis solisilvae]MDR6800347.1 pectate lyase [Asticcacaulis sp. BE141]
MTRLIRRRTLLFSAAALSGAAAFPAVPASSGLYTRTRGGQGGRIVRVTSLATAGEGSLKAALEQAGPRIIVFEVGGIIDLAKTTLKITEPFVTIAGETAPGPGITLIRGGVQVAAHDVIVRHIAVRPGTAGMAKKSGFEPDGLTTFRAHDVIIDHCSLTWAVDEALSASGPRFEGADLAEWRRNTSHRITFSNNLIAESLRDASHAKGPHSMGSLVHDNVTGVLIHGNLYAHNNERHPLVKGGGQAAVINNVFVNPGHTCAQYTLVADQWTGRETVAGRMILRGNVMRGGHDTRKGLSMLTFGGAGDLELHAADNIVTRADGSAGEVIGYYQARSDGYDEGGTYKPQAFIRAMPREVLWPDALKVLPAASTEAQVYKNCGARPWARDPIDARIIAHARSGAGRLIDSETDAGGYPERPTVRRSYNPRTLL